MKAVLLLLSISLFSQPADKADAAFDTAFSTLPAEYEYHEKSGALMINQYKDYRYEVFRSGDRAFSRVVYSSTQNEKPRPEDPRPPVREGDVSGFDLREILHHIDMFSDQSAEMVFSGTTTLDGVRCSVFDISYEYTDGSGRLWPMRGRLILSAATGTPVRMTAEQLEFPEDLYTLSVEADFTGAEPESCRLSGCLLSFTGQYGIFRYHCDVTRSFSY